MDLLDGPISNATHNAYRNGHSVDDHGLLVRSNGVKRQYNTMSSASDACSTVSSLHGYGFSHNSADDIEKWRRHAISDRWIPKHWQVPNWRKTQFGTALWAVVNDDLALNYYIMHQFGFWHPLSWWQSPSLAEADFTSWLRSASPPDASSSTAPPDSNSVRTSNDAKRLLKSTFVDTHTLDATELGIVSKPFHSLWREISKCIVDDRYEFNMSSYTSYTVDDFTWLSDLNELNSESPFCDLRLFSWWLTYIHSICSKESHHKVAMTLFCITLMLNCERVIFGGGDESTTNTNLYAWSLFKSLVKLVSFNKKQADDDHQSTNTPLPARFLKDIFGRPANLVMLLVMCWQTCRLKCFISPNKPESLISIHGKSKVPAATSLPVKQESKSQQKRNTYCYTLQSHVMASPEDQAIHLYSAVFQGGHESGSFKARMTMWFESLLLKLYGHLKQVNPSFVMPVLATHPSIVATAKPTTNDRKRDAEKHFRSIVSLCEQFIQTVDESNQFD